MFKTNGNIDDLVSSIEVELEAAKKRQERRNGEAKMLLETARTEGRSHLTPAETNLGLSRRPARA